MPQKFCGSLWIMQIVVWNSETVSGILYILSLSKVVSLFFCSKKKIWQICKHFWDIIKISVKKYLRLLRNFYSISRLFYALFTKVILCDEMPVDKMKSETLIIHQVVAFCRFLQYCLLGEALKQPKRCKWYINYGVMIIFDTLEHQHADCKMNLSIDQIVFCQPSHLKPLIWRSQHYHKLYKKLT